MDYLLNLAAVDPAERTTVISGKWRLRFSNNLWSKEAYGAF
jgi:hypothetical protein